MIGPNLVNRSAEPRPSDSNKTTRVERFDGSIAGLGGLIPVLVSSGSKGGTGLESSPVDGSTGRSDPVLKTLLFLKIINFTIIHNNIFPKY